MITSLPPRSGKRVLFYPWQPFSVLPKLPVLRLFRFQKEDATALHCKVFTEIERSQERQDETTFSKKFNYTKSDAL